MAFRLWNTETNTTTEYATEKEARDAMRGEIGRWHRSHSPGWWERFVPGDRDLVALVWPATPEADAEARDMFGWE